MLWSAASNQVRTQGAKVPYRCLMECGDNKFIYTQLCQQNQTQFPQACLESFQLKKLFVVHFLVILLKLNSEDLVQVHVEIWTILTSTETGKHMGWWPLEDVIVA